MNEEGKSTPSPPILFADGWLSRVQDATEVDLASPGEADVEIARLRALLRTAFAHAPIGLAVVDRSGRVVIANPALCTIVGVRVEALVGRQITDFVESDKRGVESLDAGRVLAGELTRSSAMCTLRLPDGNTGWAQVTVASDEQRPPLMIYQIEDATERQRLQGRLEYLIDHDLLTGLFNRRRFEQELDLALTRHARAGVGGAVLMLDLDGFKAINDEFGHAIGNQLLCELAGALRERCRASDVLARLGGDEFAVLLSAASAADARRVADALVGVIAAHLIVVGGERASVTASIGVAMVNGEAGVELLASADAAMYAAKEQGRNRYVMFDPADPHSTVAGRLLEASQLRRALRRSSFVLLCQPIISLADEHVEQYELLIRMQSETVGELISPNAFLYAAERFGLIAEIDAWVISRAAELIAAAAREGRRVVLAVNISGRSISQPELSTHIDRVLEQSAIDPSCLVFEVTETAAIADLPAARTFAKRLHSRGCGLALDDFGAGFASFYYLKALPFNYVKIDGNFVQSLDTSRTDQLLISAIVTVARGMGKETIAECVTSQATIELLKASGVDYGQGFYIATPLPVEDVLPAAVP